MYPTTSAPAIALGVISTVPCAAAGGPETCPAPLVPASGPHVAIEPALSSAPGAPVVLAMVAVPGQPGDWYALEQPGVIRVYRGDRTLEAIGELLDIRDRVATEYYGTNPGFGALSLALHPQFEQTGQAFVYYTAETDPYEVRLSRFTSFDGGQTLDAGSEEVLLAITLGDPKHLGAHLAFDLQQRLLLSLGFGDEPANAQDTATLWGSLLRLDVDAAFPYAIPADNPFATGGGRPEIYAWGFRNPWRFSIDRHSGALWLGDVGEDRYEEVDLVIAGGNYGWPIREAAHCYPSDPCDPAGLIDPVVEYAHESASPFVVGGHVYRGAEIPVLDGAYLYADGDETVLYALYCDVAGSPEPQVLLQANSGLRSFAESALGELYLLMADGAIYRLVSAAGDSDGDGWLDQNDNCTQLANAAQRDTDGDGYGNRCDADLDNDGTISFLDLGRLKSVLFTADPDADFDGDGTVDFSDLAIMKASFFGMPGPSGIVR